MSRRSCCWRAPRGLRGAKRRRRSSACRRRARRQAWRSATAGSASRTSGAWSCVSLQNGGGGPLVVPEAPHLRESAAGRTLPMAGTYASELSARAVPDERPVNADAEVAQGLDEQPGTIPLPRSTRSCSGLGTVPLERVHLTVALQVRHQELPGHQGGRCHLEGVQYVRQDRSVDADDRRHAVGRDLAADPADEPANALRVLCALLLAQLAVGL